MKIMALHLPAYHQVPENDEWWGKGFTEWDNVRSGEIYYDGQVQPVVPYRHCYYDLSKKADLEKQIDLANQYGVDGFIFYHYWFGDGRQIFEKPPEMLRDCTDKKTNYCFCWANESWITTWHGKDPSTLIHQTYGNEDEWLAHIKYLLSFFRDPRYSRIEGRPVLYIYKPNEIPEYDKMIRCWDNYLERHGIGPVYLIEFISSKNPSLHSERSDSVMEFEPLYSTYFDINIFNKLKRVICKCLKRIDFQNYDTLWECILNRKRIYNGKKIIRSCFVAWDNSPRKEKASMIVRGSSPRKFSKYLTKLLLSQRKDLSEEMTVINAWNEWSEGAFLEPSEQLQFQYLEALRDAVKLSMHPESKTV